MVKTIYFDLGNVLCFFSHQKMMNQLSACSGIPIDRIKTMLVEEKLQELYELGKINTQFLFETLKKQSNKVLSISEFTQAISDIFVPNTALWPLIRQLKNQGLRLILLSNTCESHYEWIYDHYPVLKLFDHQILSYKVGLTKPDPNIFIKALEASKCAPSECFYTDDIPAYVESARRVGIDSEVYTNVENLKKHLIKRYIPI